MWAILAVGLPLLLPIYTSRAYSPDEVWFADLAAEMADKLEEDGIFRFVRKQTNELGYGAIYWIAYAVLSASVDVPIVIARWLALAAMASVPCCAAIYAFKRKTSYGWLAVALWFTFPLCWWTGKLTGPETFSLGLSTIGVTLVMLQTGARMLFLGAVFLGLAIGIKLTSIPVAVFAAFVVVARSERRFRSLALLGAGLLLGFVAANPFILFYPKHFFRTLSILPSEINYGAAKISLGHFAHIYSNSTWEWDNVMRGGFFDWGLSAPAVVLCGLFLWRAQADRRILAAFAVTMLATTFFLMCLSRYLGWYWFALIALIPLVICEARRTSRGLVLLGALVVLLNAAFAYPTIQQQLKTRRSQLTAIEAGAAWQAAAEGRIRENSVSLKRVVWCLPPGAARRPTIRDAVPAERDFASVHEWRAYTWIHQTKFLDDLEPGDNACIVLFRPYRQIWDSVRAHPRIQINQKFEVRETGLENIDLIFLRRL